MNKHVDIKRSTECLEVEQSLLGAILVNNEALDVAQQVRLEASHFSEPLHVEMYSKFCDLAVENRPITPAVLAPIFQGDLIIPEMSVGEYIARLMANAATVINCREYALEIIASAARREIVSIFEEGLSAAQHTHTRGSLIIDDVSDRLQGVRQDFTRAAITRFTLGDAAGEALEQAQERIQSGSPSGVPTGLHDLDRAIGGFQRRELTVIGGRPSMGKTAIATSLLLDAAKRGHGVGFFSLEMDSIRLAERCLTDLSWNQASPIEYTNIRKGDLTQNEIDRLRDAQDKLKSMPFLIDHQPGLNLVQVMAIARQMRTRMERKGFSLDVICIDHMDKLKGSGYWRGNAVQEAGEKSNGLAEMAKELDVSVVALKQLSRATENRDDKRPTLADLRMSGDVEQDADLIIFPFREAYYLERQTTKSADEEADRIADLEAKKHVLELIVAKNRSGSTRTVKAYVDIASSAVRSLS